MMSANTTSRMTTREQLAEAREAYHKLQTGQAASVFVDQNGERVEFVPANSARLAAYIDHLEAQIAGQNRRTAIHFQTSKGV